MSTADNNTNADENVVELPDDFFDEFEDDKLLDEIVEGVVPEQTQLIRTDDTNGNSVDTSKLKNDPSNNNNNESDDEPELRHCLDEIKSLTESIERRKQKLRNEMLGCGKNIRKNPRSHSPSSSKRPERSGRSHDRDRRRSPIGPRNRRDRSRSRERNRSRDRRSSRGRRERSRSRSDSPVYHARSMSFLEELERKFAEKGQDFPEMKLLMELRDKKTGTAAAVSEYSAATNVVYQQRDVPVCTMPPTYMQMPMSMYHPPYHPNWNGNFMMMTSSMQHTVQQMPLQPPLTNTPPNVIHNAFDKKAPRNKAEVVARCRAASKILRGEENKVPKLRFLFTRTSMPMDAFDEEPVPLQSRKNVEFELTSANQKPIAPLQFLPQRTRELVKTLGYNCSVILNRLRLKDFADRVVNDIQDIDSAKKRTKERSYADCEMQTESYKCPTCIHRDAQTFSNKSIQTDGPKKVNIRTQTNEKDYRDPLIRSLSRLTAGQLVAVSDFVNLVCEPRPTTSTELFSVREKLMDIYNLSDRGVGAVEAEQAREHESRRRTSMPSPPLEDLRASIRGTSDQNIGRVAPPPPPLLYHMDGGMMDTEQEQRLKQIRYEENVRLQIEEQRRLEWERQQVMQEQLIQQQQLMQQQQLIQQQQQRQLQLQREQEEENARLEMRNDRRNGFGRVNNHWNGARGRGSRY